MHVRVCVSRHIHTYTVVYIYGCVYWCVVSSVYIDVYVCVHVNRHIHVYTLVYMRGYVYVRVVRRLWRMKVFVSMGWLRIAGSLQLYVSFAKEPYKREDILQKRPIFLRSLQHSPLRCRVLYGVATIRRLLKIIGLFGKRAL